MSEANGTVEAIPETAAPTVLTGGEQASATVEALKKEDTLRFGPGVKTRMVEKFPIANITAPDGFNIRIAKGQVIAGIRVEKDTRNIPGMVDSIRQLDGITDPLTLSEREDGTCILLQGYRRYNASKLIRAESPDSPLAAKLENLPVIIYSGLTQQQERQLVNDQRSKSFSALEVYRWYNEQLDGGFEWLNILRRCYHEIGQVTGSAAKVKEIDDIQDEKERDKELRAWATSYVFQWWVNAWKARPLLREMTEQTYMFKEGLTAIRPRVVLTSMRMRALWKEADADMKAGEFNRTTGTGPRLEEKLKFFETEDKGLYNEDGTRKNKGAGDGPKLRPVKEVVDFLAGASPDTNNPTLVGRILGIAFKDGGAPDAVQEIANYEKCKGVFTTLSASVDPKLRAGLNFLFVGGEGAVEQFEAFLKDSKPEPVKATPEVETATTGKGGKKGK